ncbi:MAG: M20/M25/M40 family metallo-hydrolase [Acidimicrobiia bacterium]|nr:M20/M25/M40 family metallo-hydrolase [Acidimicrobiia bacterium]NNL28370.1 M20/M25/M40 family metallo-hydrolase [Acidimicrobiia bacterium]
MTSHKKPVRKRALAIMLAAMMVVTLLPAAAGAKPSKKDSSPSCDSRVNNTIDKLLECVTVEGVREHQAAFQAHADANGGIRTSGTPGYDASVAYVADRMEAAGYDVTVQPFDFTTFIITGPSTLEQVAPGSVTYVEETDYTLMSQTDAGDATGSVTGVDLALGDPGTSTSGCEAADFAGFPAGDIALMQRGACAFGLKADNAAAAGAVGAIIFNQGNTPEREGLINGTLGADYAGGIPVVFATFPRGVEWAATSGLEMRIAADVFRGEATTFNVIAETPKGDPDNVIMVGAHLDSVNQGPGIQDNGSGSAAILEVAEQMAKVKPVNKVRFAWWGAEESGLIGSEHYVAELSEEELDQIALYLNFDMIGSPNYFFGIYDGDDSDAVGAGPGPEGSAQIEKTFEAYFNMVGEPFQGTDFSGRSDYGPFIEVGIPAGGLFTGAEGIKTPEEVLLYGGTAGIQYDPCYHLACDTFDNISLHALDVNSDAVAFATLNYAMSTELINDGRSKGNFKPWKVAS